MLKVEGDTTFSKVDSAFQLC